jgi:lipoic acid synthetase
VNNTERKPDWIRYRIPGGEKFLKVRSTVNDLGLHTIYTEAGCPNSGECFARGTATFLILGDTCTRNCRYCSVNKGVPASPDYSEPEKIAQAVRELKLKYVVITSVTRDDLADGGASIFAETCRQISIIDPGISVELLIPDFRYSLEKSFSLITKERIDILNHNIEAVESFFPVVRPAADYKHSLRLLKLFSEKGLTVKSGLMIGFGETVEQIKSSINDLVKAGCRIITVGQYLKPGKEFYDVKKYYHPDEFEEIKEFAINAGIEKAVCGPNVRSSYLAETII